MARSLGRDENVIDSVIDLENGKCALLLPVRGQSVPPCVL